MRAPESRTARKEGGATDSSPYGLRSCGVIANDTWHFGEPMVDGMGGESDDSIASTFVDAIRSDYQELRSTR